MALDPRTYPAKAAELHQSLAGEKYRPSNGMEGEIFMEAWCYRCAKWNTESGCPIVNATMLYREDDPEYPAEWRIGEDGQPECTAFGTEPVPECDPVTLDLFAETAP
jgi:hypothetical protein